MSETLGTATLDLSTDNTGLDKGLGEAESTTSSKMSKISGVIGKGTAAAAAGFAVAGAAAVGSAIQIASVGDAAAESAQQAGLATEEYQELSFALEEVGLSNPDAALQKFSRRLGDASRESGPAQKAFEDLGIAIENADGSLRDTNDVMDESIKRLAEIDDDARRASIAGNMFGKNAGNQLAASLSEGASAIDDARQKAREFGIVLDDEAIDASSRLMDSMGDLKNSFIGAFRTAFTPVMMWLADTAAPILQNVMVPAIQKVADVVGGLFALVFQGDFQAGLGRALGIHEDSPLITGALTLRDGIAGLFEKISDVWNSFDEGAGLVEKVIGVFSGLGDEIAGGGFFEPLFGAIQDVFGSIVDWLTSGGIETILNTILDTRERMLDAGMKIFTSLLDAAVDFLPKLINWITGTLIPKVVDFIVMSVPQILDAAIQLFESLVEAVTTVLPKLISTLLGDVLPKLLDAILVMLPEVLSAAIELFTVLVQAVAEILPQLISVLLGDVLPTVLNTLLSMLPQIMTAAITIFTALIDALILILPQLIDTIITDVIPALTVTLIQNMPKIVEAGIILITGLIDAFIQMGPQIANAVLTEIIGKGIDSPLENFSLVETGKTIIRSLWNGIKAMGAWLRSQVGGFIESALPDVISDRLDMGSPSRVLMEMGKEAVVGFEQGMSVGQRGIEKKAGQMADMLFRAFKDVPGLEEILFEGDFTAKFGRALDIHEDNPLVSRLLEAGRQTNIQIHNPEPEPAAESVMRIERRRQLGAAG